MMGTFFKYFVRGIGIQLALIVLTLVYPPSIYLLAYFVYGPYISLMDYLMQPEGEMGNITPVFGWLIGFVVYALIFAGVVSVFKYLRRKPA